MKIKLLISMKQDGQSIDKDSVVNIDEITAESWINKGWAKKESKIKKQTKELKIDSKETKNETNKD
jgi:hypothetical protein